MAKNGKTTAPVEVDHDDPAPTGSVQAPPETVQADGSELLGVPFLGAVRIAALAQAGIVTISELKAATPESIGSVKGVGLRNAERIKAWLSEQDTAQTQEHMVSIPAEIAGIDGAVSRIREANPKKGFDKKLSRQLNKVLNRVSEVPVAFESLGDKEKQQALKALDRIATLLVQAADKGPLSDKKQHVVGGAIKAKLKKLDKALDD
jgi:NAD-dependent DNA ligase